MQTMDLINNAGETSISKNSKTLAELSVEQFNSEPGDLTGYDCSICKNKGIVAILQDEEDKYKPCTCMAIRAASRIERDAGLKSILENYTFDRYIVTQPWQSRIVDIAKAYARKKDGWFYISGNCGTGKTHICTSIVNQLISDRIPCKCMMWREEGPRIKAVVNSAEYSDLVYPLKETPCLYIDDFLKGGTTQGDINLAFEIINYRYNAGLMTIISSERSIEEILQIDEAIGSRIYERAEKGENIIDLKNVENYRLRG